MRFAELTQHFAEQDVVCLAVERVREQTSITVRANEQAVAVFNCQGTVTLLSCLNHSGLADQGCRFRTCSNTSINTAPP